MDIDHGNRQRLAFPATALNAVLDRTRRITVGRPDLVEVGPVLLVFALEPPIELPAQITSIVTTTVREVTDEPTPDQDLAAAAAALLVEHPDLGANDPVAVVRFKVVQSWQLWRALEHHRPGPGSLWMDWRALRRHEELAPLVREELTAAGFVVAPEFPSRRSGSSGVSVEPSEEGVYVTWHVGETLRAASRAARDRGAFNPATGDMHPSIHYSGTVDQVMQEALARILHEVGFGIRTDSGVDEVGLVVTGRRNAPHWRDPVDPALDGAQGFRPGVKVRVTAGEHIGEELLVVQVHQRMETHEIVFYLLYRADADELIEVLPGNVEFAADAADWPRPEGLFVGYIGVRD